MKGDVIGTSFGRCLVDLYEGVIDLNRVKLIITSTRYKEINEDVFEEIWEGYTTYDGMTSDVWRHYAGNEQAKSRIRELVLYLYRSGKIHQPRTLGGYGSGISGTWVNLTPITYSEYDARGTYDNEIPEPPRQLTAEELNMLLGAMI